MPSPAEDAGSGAADSGGESRDLAGDGGDHVVEAGPEDAGGGDGGAGEDGDEDRVFQHRGAGLSRFASRSAHGVGVSSACPRPLRGRFMVRDADRLPRCASGSGHGAGFRGCLYRDRLAPPTGAGRRMRLPWTLVREIFGKTARIWSADRRLIP